MTAIGRMQLVLFITLLLITLTVSSSSSDGETLLKPGDSGPKVLALQGDMHKLGYLSDAPTGYYGEITWDAVLKLQEEYHLNPDGIIGQETNQLINRLVSSLKVTEKEVLGFFVGEEPSIPSSMDTLRAQKDKITSISPFWYRLDRNDPGQLETGSNVTREEMDNVISFDKQNGIKTYTLVHNLLYGKSVIGRDVVHAVLTDPDRRRELVTNIFNLLNSRGFDGVTIDIENIYPGDRGLFIQFLAELSAQLKPSGYTLITCVPAKTSDKHNGGWGDNFNYHEVGKYSDIVAIMAYDEHGSFSKSGGPIASIGWVERVAEYALTKLPPEKILLGIPGYGFDWNVDQGSSRYLSYELAMQTAHRFEKSVTWDSENKVPYFNYLDNNGHRHKVYFENAASTAAKLDVVKKYNLQGIAIWRLGMEDPGSWPVIAEKL